MSSHCGKPHKPNCAVTGTRHGNWGSKWPAEILPLDSGLAPTACDGEAAPANGEAWSKPPSHSTEVLVHHTNYEPKPSRELAAATHLAPTRPRGRASGFWPDAKAFALVANAKGAREGRKEHTKEGGNRSKGCAEKLCVKEIPLIGSCAGSRGLLEDGWGVVSTGYTRQAFVEFFFFSHVSLPLTLMDGILFDRLGSPFLNKLSRDTPLRIARRSGLASFALGFGPEARAPIIRSTHRSLGTRGGASRLILPFCFIGFIIIVIIISFPLGVYELDHVCYLLSEYSAVGGPTRIFSPQAFKSVRPTMSIRPSCSAG